MDFKRREPHRRNEELEELLSQVNALLWPAEMNAIEEFKATRYPILLIMGAPRSGTTLLLQWISQLGLFSYPTNILSRFYMSPYIGALIQLMLTKHDFNNEIFDFNQTIPYSSVLGKTKGVLAPNEFWYFWRRFFKFSDITYLNEEELEKIDHRTLVSELAAIEYAFGQPFAAKGMMLNWIIPYIDNILEKVLFLYIHRNPFYNIQSLLEARVNYYGDERAWYSFKPPEYPQLVDSTPCEQVAGQIYHTNSAVERNLAMVHSDRSLHIRYEDFCRFPGKVFEQIGGKLRLQGYGKQVRYQGPESFQAAEQVRMAPARVEEVISSYEKFAGYAISPKL